MAFQLVLATDSEITVWHTEFGHLYGFGVDESRGALVDRFMREAPDAEQPAGRHRDDARVFAAGLARDRRLIAR